MRMVYLLRKVSTGAAWIEIVVGSNVLHLRAHASELQILPGYVSTSYVGLVGIKGIVRRKLRWVKSGVNR